MLEQLQQRDYLDLWLAETSRGNLFAVVRWAISLSRWILSLFVRLTHLVSCTALRQMEFDADNYEARVAGSKQFRETTHTLLRLNVAYQATYANMARAWRNRRLAKNVPELVADHRKRVPDDLMKLAQRVE